MGGGGGRADKKWNDPWKSEMDYNFPGIFRKPIITAVCESVVVVNCICFEMFKDNVVHGLNLPTTSNYFLG